MSQHPHCSHKALLHLLSLPFDCPLRDCRLCLSPFSFFYFLLTCLLLFIHSNRWQEESKALRTYRESVQANPKAAAPLASAAPAAVAAKAPLRSARPAKRPSQVKLPCCYAPNCFLSPTFLVASSPSMLHTDEAEHPFSTACCRLRWAGDRHLAHLLPS